MYKFLVRLITGLALTVIVSHSSWAETRTLVTSTGYHLDYDVRGLGAGTSVALIIMHGKNFPADGVLSRMTAWSDRVARDGFTVYTPVMPWSARWDGTHEDATSALDALVDMAAKDGKKVIIGGHSMGAMFTILYRASALPASIIGKFVSAPGHMLDLIPANSSFWNDINPSLAKAKSMMATGKGAEKIQFGGRNTSGRQNIIESYAMSPEVYLSWHDPQRLPRHTEALKATLIPVLWTIGSDDPLLQNNASKDTFRTMPANTRSSYVLVEGKDHSTSFMASTEKLIAWMKSLEGL